MGQISVPGIVILRSVVTFDLLRLTIVLVARSVTRKFTALILPILSIILLKMDDKSQL
jgi:hypothetical protein